MAKNNTTDIQKFTQGLSELTDFEMQFLLALCGVDPPGKPLNPKEAYLLLRPHVKKITAQNYAGKVLARIRAKGALPEFFEYRNLGINRAAEILHECTKAENVRIIRYGGGAWDYVRAPDYRTRLRAARMLLELNGAIGSEAIVNINVDARKTFSQAVAEHQEMEDQKRLALSTDVKDAEFEDES